MFDKILINFNDFSQIILIFNRKSVKYGKSIHGWKISVKKVIRPRQVSSLQFLVISVLD